MAFDALKGLREELQIREEKRTRVQKKSLSEEQIERISKTLSRVEPGSSVSVCLYSKGHYITVEGTVTELSRINEYFKLGNEKVFFDDIYQIRLL